MHLFTNLAYLDAGTGSLIIQSVVGAAAGVAVFGRRSIANVKAKLTGKDKQEPVSTPAKTNEDVKTTSEK